MLLVLDTNRYCLLEIEHEYERSDDYIAVSMDEIDPYWACKAGMIDQEECERCIEEDRLQRNEENLVFERQQYESLKAKFEGE